MLIVILGGSITKPVLRNIAENNLEHTIIMKSSVDSLDARIDDIYYKVAKIQFQIDRIKNIFSSETTDENKYQKEKHEVFMNNVYNPLLEILIFIYRGIFFLVSILVFMAAVIIHLRSNSIELRRRRKKLEDKIAVKH